MAHGGGWSGGEAGPGGQGSGALRKGERWEGGVSGLWRGKRLVCGPGWCAGGRNNQPVREPTGTPLHPLAAHHHPLPPFMSPPREQFEAARHLTLFTPVEPRGCALQLACACARLAALLPSCVVCCVQQHTVATTVVRAAPAQPLRVWVSLGAARKSPSLRPPAKRQARPWSDRGKRPRPLDSHWPHAGPPATATYRRGVQTAYASHPSYRLTHARRPHATTTVAGFQQPCALPTGHSRYRLACPRGPDCRMKPCRLTVAGAKAGPAQNTRAMPATACDMRRGGLEGGGQTARPWHSCRWPDLGLCRTPATPTLAKGLAYATL